MAAPTIPTHLQTLSDDAKAIAGGHFGLLMQPGKGSLTFSTPHRLTARAKDALVELTEAGVCKHEVLADGAWRYSPLINCGCFARWLGANQHVGRFPTVMKDGSVPASAPSTAERG